MIFFLILSFVKFILALNKFKFFFLFNMHLNVKIHLPFGLYTYIKNEKNKNDYGQESFKVFLTC